MKTLTNWSDYTQKLTLISYDRLGLHVSVAGLSCISLNYGFLGEKIFLLRYYDDWYMVCYRALPIVILSDSLNMNIGNMNVRKHRFNINSKVHGYYI